jgi:exodeoxyribonuclease VII large subunit
MATQPEILTVTAVTRHIKRLLEGNFPSLAVQGEISNFKLHTSGHAYFTLKDEGAQLSCVMWRSRVGGLAFTPEDGMKVIATGRITVYEPRGNYQCDVVSLRPLGVGELQVAFERLKAKLSGEGLFDAARKKPLPEYPSRIGIVTSPTGAALQDILNILGRRFPGVTVILNPVRVQGAGAAAEIAQAVDDFGRFGAVDVLIVGRGGGSLEDLWAFNEEVVARAIARSPIPIVSAVGHEVDFTIADFVADLRAPTPSAAAELVVRDRRELLEVVRNNWYTINDAVMTLVADARKRIRHLLESHALNRPVDRLHQNAQRLDELDRAITVAASHLFAMTRARQKSLGQRLAALDPRMTLKRGYTIVHRNGHIIPSRLLLKTADTVDVEFHDGTVRSVVQ